MSGPGLFAAAVLDRFGHLAVEDEGRLRNHRIREHFLTRLFALARLRDVGVAGRRVPGHRRVPDRRRPLAYRLPVAFIPSGKISFQPAMKRFISSSVPIETRR